jgi:hypothetical protein
LSTTRPAIEIETMKPAGSRPGAGFKFQCYFMNRREPGDATSLPAIAPGFLLRAPAQARDIPGPVEENLVRGI